MTGKSLRRLALPAALCLTAFNVHADITLNERVQFFEFFHPGQDPEFSIDVLGPASFSDDYSLPSEGFVRLLQTSSPPCSPTPCSPLPPVLTVDLGSTLQSALGIYTRDFTQGDVKSEIYVDGEDSRIEIGSGGANEGNIRLNGKGDFDITNGGVVDWTGTSNCDGEFFSCDILIGATPVSNTGIRVIDTDSLLDASNTNGRLFVGYVPSLVEGDSEDFLVMQNGGKVRSNGGSVGKGHEGPGSWDATVGYVQGSAFVDNGMWLVQGTPGDDSSLNIGEGDGGSGNVFIVNGGIIDITGNPGDEAGFFLGQTEDGVPTVGGSNLLLVDGAGSTLSVDNNLGIVSGSRIANGFVTVQNGGALQLDSSVLLVSGKTGASLSSFNTGLAFDALGISGLSDINLDVLSEGSVTITDIHSAGISALIIGQTPNMGPTESADVHVSGSGSNITVINDPNLPKIALAATTFGIPTVSNIGTGSLTIEDGGAVTFDHGDFVIAARAADDATVTVIDIDATLTADRVIVGWTDFEGGGVSVGASSGTLRLENGTVEGDVIVDDNGTLIGVGTINGTLLGHGGLISIGLSPGTITVKNLVLGTGTELVMEVGLNLDGSINVALSDAIVVTEGDLNLSAGDVTLELYSVEVDPETGEVATLEKVLEAGEPLAIDKLFTASGAVTVNSVTVTSSSGDPLLEVKVVNEDVRVKNVFNKATCKNDGWESLFRTNDSIFDNQGDCIQYVNTDK